MLITSHLVATTSILLIAQKTGIELTSSTVLLSYALGVGIDLDHILLYPKTSLEQLRSLAVTKTNYVPDTLPNHSFLQRPITCLILLLILYGFNLSVIPAICLGIHILMDTLVSQKQLLWPWSARYFSPVLKPSFNRKLFEFVTVLPFLWYFFDIMLLR